MRDSRQIFLKTIILTTVLYISFFYFVSFTFSPKHPPHIPNIHFLGSILNRRDVQIIDHPKHVKVQNLKTREILEQRQVDDFNFLLWPYGEKKPSFFQNTDQRRTTKKTQKQWSFPSLEEKAEGEQPLANEQPIEHKPLKLPTNAISY